MNVYIHQKKKSSFGKKAKMRERAHSGSAGTAAEQISGVRNTLAGNEGVTGWTP